MPAMAAAAAPGPLITPAPTLVPRANFPTYALTTTFKPSTDCNRFTQSSVAVLNQEPSCFPSGMRTGTSQYFSPGIQCPVGYATACMDNNGLQSVTTVTCCPTVQGVTLSCVDDATLSGVWETLFCTWIAPEKTTTVEIWDVDASTASTVSMASPAGLNAYGIRMLFESSDVASSEKTTATGTATDESGAKGAAAGATATDGAGSAQATTGQGADGSGEGEEEGSSGLSRGATVAIGVVIPVAVLLLAAAAFFLYRRRRAHHQAETQNLAGAIFHHGQHPPEPKQAWSPGSPGELQSPPPSTHYAASVPGGPPAPAYPGAPLHHQPSQHYHYQQHQQPYGGGGGYAQSNGGYASSIQYSSYQPQSAGGGGGATMYQPSELPAAHPAELPGRESGIAARYPGR